MKNYFIVVISMSLLMGCAGESPKSDKIDIATIYQKHKASYRTSGTLFLESEFMTNAKWDRDETEKSGDHIELSAPANITFNGAAMNKDNSVFTGAMYTKQQDGLPSELVWEWTDNAGKKYKNSVRMNFIGIKEENATYNDGGLVVQWEGLPVQENEEVVVSIEGNVGDKSETSVKSTTTVGDKSILFAYELMKRYSGEAITIEVSRKALIPVQEGTTAGGHILLTYDGGHITTSAVSRIRF